VTERAYVSWYGGERLQTWRTPPAFFHSLNAEYNFTLDGASDEENALLPRSRTADEILVSWAGERVFCNPPWSRIREFVELAAFADLAVLLVPARTNCRWFHRALELGAEVRFFKPKLKFVGAPHVSPVDCVLLVFGQAEEVAA
jgi:phage N-6-adenine-methyltransferase